MKSQPKSVTAVLKYTGDEKYKKKKKARPIDGRQVQDAYFAKQLETRRPSPLEMAWNNILARFPEELQQNIRNTCRSYILYNHDAF